MRCACRCEAIKILEGLSSDRQRQPFRLEIGAFGILKKKCLPTERNFVILSKVAERPVFSSAVISASSSPRIAIGSGLNYGNLRNRRRTLQGMRPLHSPLSPRTAFPISEPEQQGSSSRPDHRSRTMHTLSELHHHVPRRRHLHNINGHAACWTEKIGHSQFRIQNFSPPLSLELLCPKKSL